MAHDIGDPDRVPSMPSVYKACKGRVKTFAKTEGRKIFIDEYDLIRLGSRLCRRWVMSEHQVTSSRENESWKTWPIYYYTHTSLRQRLNGSKVFRDIANVYIREMLFRFIHCYSMGDVRVPIRVAGCISFFFF